MSAAPISSHELFGNLQKVIAIHETYWKAAARHNPHVASWIAREWEPWVADWFGIAWTRVPNDQVPGLISDQATSLSQLRERAAGQGIPVPDLGAVQPQVDTPHPRMDPRIAQLNQATNERFWEQTGYKPGRQLSRHDPEDVKMMPTWLNIRKQVALEAAQQAARGAADALTSFDHPRGQTDDPLTTEINETTWRKFWNDTGYKPGQRLDWTDLADQKMHNTWVSIRFEIVRQIAAERGQKRSPIGLESPDPWRVMQSAPPAKVMHLPMPYYQRNFIGSTAQPNGAQRAGVLAQVAPVLAPATGGFTAKVELDDNQRIHVSICVDGKCYDASMDLAPAIAAVMSKIAREHTALHASMPGAARVSPQISGEVAIDAIDQAVGAAGDEMIAALIDHHIGCVCGSWIDDIGNAIKGVGETVYKGVTDTAKKLKGPIEAVAVAAATAAGGPAAGAAAAKFIGPLIDKAAGSPKAAAQVKAIEQKAKTDPTVADALATAQQAVAHTVAAFHVEDTAKKAAAGHPEAQQQLEHVAQAAEQGDPAAHAATDIVHNTFTSEISKRSGRRRGRHHHGRQPRPFDPAAFVEDIDAETDRQFREQTGYTGPRPDRHDPATAQYVPSWMSIRADIVRRIAGAKGDRVATGEGGVVTSGEPWLDIVGNVPWMDIVTPLGVVSRDSGPWQPLVGGEPWLEIIGAEVDDATRSAMNALRKQAANHAAASSGPVVGVVRTPTGQWIAVPFNSSDEADDWFGIAKHDPTAFVYAAYFEKGSTGPAIVNEAFGHATARPQPHGPDIRRGIATTA